MFLSLGFTFLSLLVSDLNNKKQEKKLEAERKKLDDIIKDQDSRQINLNNLIKKIKEEKKGD